MACTESSSEDHLSEPSSSSPAGGAQLATANAQLAAAPPAGSASASAAAAAEDDGHPRASEAVTEAAHVAAAAAERRSEAALHARESEVRPDKQARARVSSRSWRSVSCVCCGWFEVVHLRRPPPPRRVWSQSHPVQCGRKIGDRVGFEMREEEH